MSCLADFLRIWSIAPTACVTAGCLQIGRRRQATVCVQCLGRIYYCGRPTASRRILPPQHPLRILSIRHSVVFEELLKASDEQLLGKITHNQHHLLYNHLPPPSTASQNYNLRTRIHNRQLPDHSGHLTDCNFFTRLLYNDI